jgi:superfamily I DNA/RNA helicase
MLPLNPEQQKAVKTTKGRVLILAGAGSGKTSVLACRMAHLIKNLSISPQAILGLTFTNKAAEEMQQRVAAMIGPKLAKQVTLCTFHSFCMQVLRKEISRLGYTSKFSLYDEKDVKRLVTQMARQILQQEGDLPSLDSTLAKISHTKNKGLAEPEKDEEKKTWHDKFTSDLFEKLQVCMRAYNAVDFDSLLSLTVQLFREHPDVLNAYQERYQYIMIDEYQDTNPIQYTLASLLSGKYNNLCVVGDDDQSIYGWRGAEIKHILNFEADVVIKLQQNYRSTPIILKAANAVIHNNKKRHAKALWTENAQVDPIILFHAPTDLEEAQSVVQRMVWARKHKGLKWRDMAILYRSNILSRPFETALIQAMWEDHGNWVRGIPYQIFGGTELYERSEIKDLMAYLKVLLNPQDVESLLRIINVPRRGIAESTLDILTQVNRKQEISLWEVLKKADTIPEISARALKNIQAFVQTLETARQKFETEPLHSALQWFLEEINYKKAIEEDVKSDKMRAFKWENVCDCVNALSGYEEMMQNEGREAEISLHDFLSNTLLDPEKPFTRKKEKTEDKVTLMTFHSAKGLEFPACFLVGLEDHLIPHEKSLSEGGIEEERRLMYVALTRAKKHLVLSMATARKKMGKDIACQPSRFLFEIPKELLQITSWQTPVV